LLRSTRRKSTWVVYARRVLGADELDRHDRLDRLAQVHPQEVHVGRLTAHRVMLGVLEHGRRALAVQRELDDGARRLQRVPQVARVHGERERIAAAAVEDAGDETFATQAAGRPRALDVAGLNGEGGGV
jgi:hypothetical protein